MLLLIRGSSNNTVNECLNYVNTGVCGGGGLGKNEEQKKGGENNFLYVFDVKQSYVLTL